jgi:hypothetical protein
VSRNAGGVEKLWMNREKPVEILITHIFLRRDLPKIIQPTPCG